MNNEKIENETLTAQQKKNKKKKEAAKKKKQLQKESRDKNVENHDKDVAETLKEEVIDNFEEELCWCIQQLEIGLKSQKPTTDQATKNRKLIDQLKSTKTSKPKKRMLMKVTFGNYREKMTKELKQFCQVEPTLFQVDDSVMKKSVFVKKKANDLPACFEKSSSPDDGFCFNFPDPT